MIAARAIFVAVVVTGCGAARSPVAYRDDAKKLFDTKDGDIKACYDKVLVATPGAAGTVTVMFAFEPKTGKLVDAKLDPARTSAPEPVSQCVLSSIGALALSPADKKTGQGTWTWSFAGAPPRA